jgi:DNA (cytosine-5)-methyltransferase 1
MTLLPDRILSGEVEAPDLFCGGTPCQAFSVAGLRNSLDDARGNLSLTFVGIANAIDHVRSVRRDAPAVIFWENVPGVLNTKDNAFGCFLGALAGETEQIVPSGDKWTNSGCVFGPQRTVAWRVLDAQYFGVAQRRRRVFVVASARDDFNPAEVLFEFEGLRRDIAPSRQAREEVAGTIAARFGISRNNHEECVATPEYLGNAEGGAREVPFLTCHNTGGTAGISNQTPLVGSYTPSSIGGYKEGVGTLRANGGDIGGGSENLVATMLDHQTVGALCADSHPGAYSGQDAYTGRLIPQPIAYSFDSLSSNSMKSSNPHSGCNSVDVSKSLDTSRGLDPTCNQGGIGVAQPIAVYENHPADSRVKEMGEVCSTVVSRWGTGGGNLPMVSQPIAFTTEQTPKFNQNQALTLTKSESKHNQCVAQPIGVDMFNAAFSGDVAVPLTHRSDGTGTGPTVMTPVCLGGQHPNAGIGIDQTPTLTSAMGMGGGHVPITSADVAPTLTASNDPSRSPQSTEVTNQVAAIHAVSMAVRRLTPVECERLQGFPDGYTNIPWRKAAESPDGPRYKALGNSWAVPVVRWIGQRIQERITT